MITNAEVNRKKISLFASKNFECILLQIKNSHLFLIKAEAMYTVLDNVCENNYSHIVVCTNNYSHIVVYENNCSHIVRKTQYLNTYFCTQCRIKKISIYGTLAGLPTRRVWKLALGASQSISQGWRGIWRVKGSCTHCATPIISFCNQ